MRPRKACLLVLLLALAQLLAVASAQDLDEGERPGGERGLRAGERRARHQGRVRPGTPVPGGAPPELAPGANLLEFRGDSG